MSLASLEGGDKEEANLGLGIRKQNSAWFFFTHYNGTIVTMLLFDLKFPYTTSPLKSERGKKNPKKTGLLDLMDSASSPVVR
jgi:hypothetical protein